MSVPVEAATPTRTPRNAVVILLDSLNRHMVGAYGGHEFATPNLDRFAAGALRFQQHYSGSLPCMPARHDLLCGSLDFLWRPWGSVEVWEDALPRLARLAGVTTHLVADHPHLFETGGENYHTDFTTWEYERGHEGDPWRTRPDPSAIGAPTLPAAAASPIPHPYDTTRSYYREETDFPGPRTMTAATQWLADNAGYHDRFLLFVDEFDPHEPFDTPEPWASRYDGTWEGPRIIWPPYVIDAIASGRISGRDAHQIRANYGAKLSMIDHWFGRVLDELDRNNVWDNTAVIVCTDHGHYLGEHDAFGKPQLPVYQTLGHIPLLVRWPGVEPRDVQALTTNVDIFATLADVFDVEAPQRTHGRSLVPIIIDEAPSVRESALIGVWGRHVQVVDGTTKYMAAPAGDNAPLTMWSNRWSTMPIHAFPQVTLPKPDERATLAFMPGSTVPVIRQPFAPGDMLPFWAGGEFDGNKLFRLDLDPDETENRAGTGSGSGEEHAARELLHAALTDVEAPPEQFERLGLG